MIFNDTNVGFAAANNIGLRDLNDSEFMVLLNNDTVVPPGWLGRLGAMRGVLRLGSSAR